MPRRVRRQGRLIQKPKNEPDNDLKADRYYIVGVKTDSTAAWREGEFRTLKKQKFHFTGTRIRFRHFLLCSIRRPKSCIVCTGR